MLLVARELFSLQLNVKKPSCFPYNAHYKLSKSISSLLKNESDDTS